MCLSLKVDGTTNITIVCKEVNRIECKLRGEDYKDWCEREFDLSEPIDY